MRHLMVCMSGWAGTGKDECAGRLVRQFGATQTGLADPGKRHCMDTYGFTYQQLWGPSKFRNAGDPRYPKPIMKSIGFEPVREAQNQSTKTGNSKESYGILITPENREHFSRLGTSLNCSRLVNFCDNNKTESSRFIIESDDPEFFLSPRELLQRYLELLNILYSDTWIDKGIADQRLIATGSYKYSQQRGLSEGPTMTGHANDYQSVITCFSDFRHIHEHKKARESADGTLVPILVRVKRPSVSKAPFNHRSETEQTRIRDKAYDFIINNDGSLEDLYNSVDRIVHTCQSPDWRGRVWSEDLVLDEVQEGYAP